MSSLLGMDSKETVDLWRLGAGLSWPHDFDDQGRSIVIF